MTKEEGDKYRGHVPLVPKSKKVKLTEGKRPILPKAAEKGGDSGTKSAEKPKD